MNLTIMFEEALLKLSIKNYFFSISIIWNRIKIKELI